MLGGHVVRGHSLVRLSGGGVVPIETVGGLLSGRVVVLHDAHQIGLRDAERLHHAVHAVAVAHEPRVIPATTGVVPVPVDVADGGLNSLVVQRCSDKLVTNDARGGLGDVPVVAGVAVAEGPVVVVLPEVLSVVEEEDQLIAHELGNGHPHVLLCDEHRQWRPLRSRHIGASVVGVVAPASSS